MMFENRANLQRYNQLLLFEVECQPEQSNKGNTGVGVNGIHLPTIHLVVFLTVFYKLKAVFAATSGETDTSLKCGLSKFSYECSWNYLSVAPCGHEEPGNVQVR